MRYVYKIHSGYDGFTPARLPSRMSRTTLRLGWKRYIDTVERGDEIWVYFHGPQKYRNGVYVRGIAKQVRYAEREVILSVIESSAAAPLTDTDMSARIATVVATRYQQVFVLPEEIDTGAVCTLATTADSCENRVCVTCRSWKALPLVAPSALNIPHRLDGHVDIYVPAYWVVPNRSFLFFRGRTIRRTVRRSSEMFMRFKMGEANLAFPLALGMHTALTRADAADADVIVPVPLSPDKAKRGELNRTLALAKELNRLTSVPVAQALTLSSAVSKRSLRTQRGYSAADFEAEYAKRLIVDPIAFRGVKRVLLLDDVCTEGSTLRDCGRAISSVDPDIEIVAVTAGQMAVKQVVVNPEKLWTPATA